MTSTSTPPRSSARQWILAAGVVGVVVAGSVVAGSLFGSSHKDTPPKPAPAPVVDSTVTVLYEVEGSTDYADVTMETPSGTAQISPDVPMVREGTGVRGLEMEFGSGAFLYLSAQNNRGYGTVVCRITVDGVVVSENEASGGYAIATCKGNA